MRNGSTAEHQKTSHMKTYNFRIITTAVMERVETFEVRGKTLDEARERFRYNVEKYGTLFDAVDTEYHEVEAIDVQYLDQEGRYVELLSVDDLD